MFTHNSCFNCFEGGSCCLKSQSMWQCYTWWVQVQNSVTRKKITFPMSLPLLHLFLQMYVNVLYVLLQLWWNHLCSLALPTLFEQVPSNDDVYRQWNMSLFVSLRTWYLLLLQSGFFPFPFTISLVLMKPYVILITE